MPDLIESYALDTVTTSLTLPADHRVLGVIYRNGHTLLLVRENRDSPMIQRRFFFMSVGQEIPQDMSMEYVGSVEIEVSSFWKHELWLIFAEVDPRGGLMDA